MQAWEWTIYKGNIHYGQYKLQVNHYYDLALEYEIIKKLG